MSNLDKMPKGREGLKAISKPIESLQIEPLMPWTQPELITDLLPDVPAFNLNLLPGVFQEYVKDVAYRMQCPAEFVAIPLMIVASSIIGTGCTIRPKQNDDWTVIPNLWGGIVGRPGMLKTPALTEPLSLLNVLEKKAYKEFEEKSREFQIENDLFEAQRSAIKEQVKRSTKNGKSIEEYRQQLLEMEEKENPSWRRYRTNDATIEKIGELLEENPRGLLYFRDELTGWLNGLEREDHAQDRAFFLESWNGSGSFTTDRIGRGTTQTDNMCLSVLGGIQPGKLTSFLYQASRETENDGLIQRFQLLVYPDQPDHWQLVDMAPNQQARQDLIRVFEFLAESDLSKLSGVNADGRLPFLRFSQEAQDLFYEWLTDLETQKLREEERPVLLEHLGKYRSLMPSLALIIHLVESFNGQSIEPVSIGALKKAVHWCGFLEKHARRIYSLVFNIHEKAAAKLASMICKGKLLEGFTKKDVYDKGWQYLNKPESAQEALDTLVERGWLRAVIQQDGAPGRPSVSYAINPYISDANVSKSSA